MEKLQKALQKARADREAAVAPAAAPESPAPTSAAPARRKILSRVVEPVVPTPEAQQVTARWEEVLEVQLDPGHLEQSRVATLSACSAASPFDILRTKVQLMMQRNGWTRLAVTSPAAACGKTTLSCNLAMGFTRQTDMRAILMDLDLRKPAVANTLGLAGRHDMRAMLLGERAFGEQAVRVGHNVLISASPWQEPDPTSVLLDRRAARTISLIEEDYAPGIMIFDLPPLLSTDDTRAFLREVDCALLVAQAGTTTVAQIDNCEREIAEHTDVLGVVLNQYRFGDSVDPSETYGYE